MSHQPGFPFRHFVLAFLVLLATCATAWTALWLVDFGPLPQAPTPVDLFCEPGAVDTLTNLGEVTVAILGIAITVVAIILELAANRYTPRITDLFLRDPVNLGMMGFYVVTAVLVIWTAMSPFGGHHPCTMVLVAVGALTASLLTIIPYFAYVFDFLSPTRIVDRIRLSTTRALQRVRRTGDRAVAGARNDVLVGVEQLGDIALNSVGQNDKAIGMAALTALSELALADLAIKPHLPPVWFDTAALEARDQDLIALHPSMVRALGTRRTWVEMKVLRQYQAVFGDAVNKMRDVNHLVAILTRRIAQEAGQIGDLHALRMALRFMNTYLRATINASDVRSAYNLFNEYRALAERLLDLELEDLTVEIARYFKFYGQLGFSNALPFVLETAAYDLCALLERAHLAQAGAHDELLSIFLDVDREPEDSTTQEAALRGVRKAQVKLATHYLSHGAEAHARRIYEDMRAEQAARLQSIRAELLSIVEPEYWEVSDRGINFDYLPPERREQLDVFFGWFADLEASPR